MSAYFVAFLQTKYGSLDEVRRDAPDDLAAHVARSKEWHQEGRLLMAGAFLDRPEEPVSTMAVFSSPRDAEEYVAGDPFVVNGMVSGWHIRPWANMLA
ncbi:MAG: YciI family protein [Chloroflexota bacterium]